MRYNSAFHDLLVLLAKDVANGKQPLKTLFLGSRIVPLRKNLLGDVRPIAVGEFLCRIIARVIVCSTSYSLLPFQLGCGTKGGVEPLIHFLESQGGNNAILSIDLKNAFNSISRKVIWQQVSARAPELERVFAWAYGSWSELYVSPGCLLYSRTGVRQGDPLGPLLFSLGYSYVLDSLHRRLGEQGFQLPLSIMTYLDDTYFLAPEQDLPRLKMVVTEVLQDMEADTGLQMRQEKTWCLSPASFRRQGKDVLGSHIGGEKEEFISRKVSGFKKTLGKLKSLKRQDAFILLRQCIQPQLVHLARTLKASETTWQELDDAICDFFDTAVGEIGLCGVDKRMISLPVRFGGCGVTCFSFLASAAFEASHGSALVFLRKLDPLVDIPPLFDDPVKSQRDQMLLKWKTMQKQLLSELSDEGKIAYIDNSSLVGSRWLSLLPINRESTFSDFEFGVALADRLHLRPRFCKSCREESLNVRHHESCASTRGFGTHRHEDLKKVTANAFRGSGADVTLEPSSTARNGRGDISVMGEATEGRKIFDVSVVTTSCVTALRRLNAVKKKFITQEGEHDDVSFARHFIGLQLQERHDLKIKRYLDCAFPGVLTALIISSGGTQHKTLLRQMKKLKSVAPRHTDQLTNDIASVLVKHRALFYMRAFLPNQSIILDRRH